MFSSEILFAQQDTSSFCWPKGKQITIRLTFDDARMSQVDIGTRLLNQDGVNATFIVVPSGVKKRLEGWAKAVDDGHEIGNHTPFHPCSCNLDWSRKDALEDFSIDRICNKLSVANKQIENLLGVKSNLLAYPCGSTFEGQEVKTKSYDPFIAELFLAGRSWLNEDPNNPSFWDFAKLTGMEVYEQTNKMNDYYAKIIFLTGGTFNNTRVLL